MGRKGRNDRGPFSEASIDRNLSKDEVPFRLGCWLHTDQLGFPRTITSVPEGANARPWWWWNLLFAFGCILYEGSFNIRLFCSIIYSVPRLSLCAVQMLFYYVQEFCEYDPYKMWHDWVSVTAWRKRVQLAEIIDLHTKRGLLSQSRWKRLITGSICKFPHAIHPSKPGRGTAAANFSALLRPLNFDTWQHRSIVVHRWMQIKLFGWSEPRRPDPVLHKVTTWWRRGNRYFTRMLVLQDESHCNEIQLLGIKRHKRHDFWQCRVNRLLLLSVCSLEDWNWSNSIWLIQIKLLLLVGHELWSIVYWVSVRWSLLRFVQSYIFAYFYYLG